MPDAIIAKVPRYKKAEFKVKIGADTMALPNGVTILVVVAFIGVLLLLGLEVFWYKTPFRRKMTGDTWKPGEQFQVERDESGLPIVYRPREKYTDPLSKVSIRLITSSTLFIGVLVLAYYFVTRGGFGSGN